MRSYSAEDISFSDGEDSGAQEEKIFVSVTDRVYGSESTTRQVYEEGAKRVALSALNGILLRIYRIWADKQWETLPLWTGQVDREFVLKFSAIEIYNECVRDLLSADGTPLRLLDDPEKGTVVDKLTEILLTDWTHLMELLAVCEGIDCASTLTATVNFIDLAGSERASQTKSAGTRLKEGGHINRSLLTLGTVIRKLRRLETNKYYTTNSLRMASRTAIICTLSPAHTHIEQSRNTLLFAVCAKDVRTSAQMEQEIVGLTQERDLARTRLEEILRAAGVDESLIPWIENSTYEECYIEHTTSALHGTVCPLRHVLRCWIDAPLRSNASSVNTL
ncbi:putative kinesin motor domain-containing protein [Tanacetum coccineum]